MRLLRLPTATYRLQFSGRFRFEDAHVLVPYFHRLGISHLYASPIFKARRGSPHGYDVTDPTRLNPELGTEEEFEALVQELRARGMGLLLDIVPNHMAASSDNAWWMDVLENGPDSPYAAFFDIDWNPPTSTLKNRVLLPILGSSYDQALENQELRLTTQEGRLFVQYYDFRLPLKVKTYEPVLSHGLADLEDRLGQAHPGLNRLNQLVKAIRRLPAGTSTDRGWGTERQKQQQAIKDELRQLTGASPEIDTFLRQNIALFNGNKGDRGSLDLLDKLLDRQVYRLAFWKTAHHEINYRRFFNINDLIGIRVEDPHTFEAVHSLTVSLAAQDKVQGLRIDHIDGLYDPLEYFNRLQQLLSPQATDSSDFPDFYVVVEKVLSGDEALPQDWPVCGTTGYDFLNTVNGLFIHIDGVTALDAVYIRATGCQLAFADVLYQKKRQVIDQLFSGEVRALGHGLMTLAGQCGADGQITHGGLAQAVAAVTACLPVYRTYIRTFEVSPQDRTYVEGAIGDAGRRDTELHGPCLEFLRRVLLLRTPAALTPRQKEEWLRLVMRWQQFTGSVTAKGLEDTALYNYSRLLSANEVGGNPGAPAISIETFHRRNLVRQAQWPYTLNATSTHDTKRGEDVRARLNVLSEMPDTWDSCLTRWQQWNQAKKRHAGGHPVPDADMEVLLYQTLLGTWPSEEEAPEFVDRVKAYAVKAAREARVSTNWLQPDPEYEEALVAFVESALETSEANEFLGDLLHLHSRLACCGALNSLSQALLKIASPGVPDLYQGTELWDFSLVDPDNRRPVDFGKRVKLLGDLIREEAEGQSSLVQQLVDSWQDGRIKVYVIYKALNTRRVYSELFLRGDYVPLHTRGQKVEHVCAFARRHEGTWALVAVPRLPAGLVDVGVLPVGREVWGEDLLLLPDDAPDRWYNVFTGETLKPPVAADRLPLFLVFGTFPVALLLGAGSGLSQIDVYDSAATLP